MPPCAASQMPRSPLRPSTENIPSARALRPHEFLQKLEVLLRLAGKPDDQGGAQGDPWDSGSKLGEQFSQKARRAPAPHRQQELVRSMLERHGRVSPAFFVFAQPLGYAVREY